MNPEAGDRPPIGVFTTDTALVVRVWDDVIASMSGIDAKDAVGKHVSELVPDIEARGLLSRFEFVRDFGSSEVLAPALHKYLIPCSPMKASEMFSRMRQLVTISGLFDGDRIDGLVIMVEDVTARIEQEKSLAAGLQNSDDRVRVRAAEAISKGVETLHADQAQQVIAGLRDKNWRVRRALVNGLAKRAAPDAVEALLKVVREEHLDFGVLNAGLQILEASSVDTTRELLEFLRSDDHDLRMQAALILGRQNNQKAVDHLLNALSDEDANVRYHAIEALGNLRSPEAVEPLLTVAESRDFFLSFAALDALKQIGDPKSAERISYLLDDELLRDAAVSTLGATGGVDAVDHITHLLNNRTLSASHASKALSELFEREEASQKNNQVAARFRQTIQTSGIAAIIEGLASGSHESAEETIRVAGWVDSEFVREALALLLDNEDLREACLEALVSHGEQAVPILIKNLENDDIDVSSAATRALGAIGSPLGTQAIISALHRDPRIAQSGLEALGKSGAPEAAETLIELLSSSDRTLRRAVVQTVKRFPNPAVLERLYGRLTDADPNVREAAIRVVGDFQAARSQSAVMEACQDPDEFVRVAAVEQLSHLNDDRSVEILSRMLDDVAPRVRAAAAQTLAGFRGEAATSALQRALQDPDAWVRYFAIRSLAAGAGTQSLQLFRELMEADPAEHVRVAAAEAIENKWV